LVDDIVLGNSFVFGWFEILYVVAVGSLAVSKKDKFVGEATDPAVGCGGPVWESGEVGGHEGEKGTGDTSNNEIVEA
jgi:hypothetical protein